MKNRCIALKRFIVLCCAFATAVAFGQATWVWTNSSADLGVATSWTNAATGASGVPASTGDGASVPGDTMLFDGKSSGPVSATSNTGAQTGSSVGGTLAGIWLHVTGNQTSPVTIHTTVANSASPGIRFNNITIDAGAGTFTLGKNSTTNVLDTIWGTSNPSSQGLTNNSANPAYILPDMRWRLGAGGAHTMVFAGTGDWYVTNDIASIGGAASLVQKDGPGTMVWTAGHNLYWGSSPVIASPMFITGGTLVLRSGALFPSTTTINHNGTALVYDAPTSSQNGGAQNISNPINGTGALRVSNGTLTFSGANTFTGNITLSGGEIFLNRAENFGTNGPLGVGGKISFAGGTLGFSVNNAYDYSPRFTNAPGQTINIDTAGVNVTFTNALTSSGGTLTKFGAGTLTLKGANTYSGDAIIGAGKLVIQGSQGTGGIIVSNNAALGVTGGGAQITPSSLAIGTTSSATLEFNNVSSTMTAPLAAGAISSSGSVTINVNSGTFTNGQSYPLFTWISGSAPAVSLGTLSGAFGNLSTNGNLIQLNITGIGSFNPLYFWTGANNGNWDTNTPNNWLQNGGQVIFSNGVPVVFNDSVTGPTNINIAGVLTPTSVTISNNSVTYSLASGFGNNIAGATGLTKSGNGTLTLSGGANTYTGITTISGGTLNIGSLANGNSASDIGAAGNSATNLVFNGGTLRYTGGAVSVDRAFTLGTNGGAIDASGSGALNLTNPAPVGIGDIGARTLTLTGTNTETNLFAGTFADSLSGASALAKSGVGKWILTGTNTCSGGTTIAGGTVQVGVGGGSGSLGGGTVANNGNLIFNRSDTLTNSGAINGSGSLLKLGSGTLILPADNSYSGGTTISSGTLQIGNGGSGSLNSSSPVTNNGALVLNTSGFFTLQAPISGSGQVMIQGSGRPQLLGDNTYTGDTAIFPGATLQLCFGNSGSLVSPHIINNGTLYLSRNDTGVFKYRGNISGSGGIWKSGGGDVTLAGSNTYTGVTFIDGGNIILGDGVTPGASVIAGDVSFVYDVATDNMYQSLIFNRPDDFTFSGNIVAPSGAYSFLTQKGSGTVTLTGNNSIYDITEVDNGKLFINGTNSDHYVAVVAGTFGGSGTVLDGVLYSAVATFAGSTLAPGPSVGSIGTLTIRKDLNIGGNVAIEVNKSLAQSNDFVVVTGVLTNQGVGTLTVSNLGPALAVGDKFTLFSQPVQNGAKMTVKGAGVNWTNNLAVDGSISVIAPPTLNFTRPTASSLQCSWTGSFKLQSQTNNLDTGIGSNWTDYPGGTNSPVNVSMSASIPAIFFRLVSIP